MQIDLKIALINRSGEKTWNEMLQEGRRHAVLADKHGFDRVWVCEHHFDIDGTDSVPNPLMLAQDFATLTERIRLGIAAVTLTTWHPLRAAEDLALLDHFTDGRLDVAFGRGILPAEVLNLNPEANRWDGSSTSQEIFAENLEIVRRAWTEDKFNWKGPRYEFPHPDSRIIKAEEAPDQGWADETGAMKYIGIVPRPLQQPTPPQYAVTESLEGFKMTARKGLKPITWYPTGNAFNKLLEAYREEREATTGEKLALGEDVTALRLCFVAETDEEARRVVEEPMINFFNFICKVRGLHVFLDDHEDPDDPQFKEMDPWDLLFERNHILAGSPETVTEKLKEMTETHGVQNWIMHMGFPGVPMDQVDRSLELFGEHVMPEMRKLEVQLASV